MSAESQVAVLTPGAVTRPATSTEERPRVRLVAFAAFAFYGVLRWQTLLSPSPLGREFALLGLAVLVAVMGELLRERSRVLLIAVAVVAAIAVLPIAGVPLGWVVHVRVAVTVNAIGAGLSALPSALVPYNGPNEWVRLVTVLGAGVLLIDAALMLALAPRGLGDLRKGAAALPLLALAVVPSTLVRPQLPYLQGLIIFGLLAAFVWGDRVRGYNAPMVVGVAGLAVAVGMTTAPALDSHQPWLNYQAIAASLASNHAERFDWSQRYGPLEWPRTGREVLDVQARRPDYWKAEDLDVFNGTGWGQGRTDLGTSAPSPDHHALVRWRQTITVSFRAMKSLNVIAAGSADTPAQLPASPGYGSGTWTADAPLQPGDNYAIRTYSPSPSTRALAAAGGERSENLLAAYRSMLLPTRLPGTTQPQVLFPPFHSALAVVDVGDFRGSDGKSLVRSSPYDRAYALATRLAGASATPYAFVASVQTYLAHGYSYNENPPVRRYPIESFLFQDKTGYCQQFAGAMALLLRMGGVPARVAVGFTTGSYDTSAHHWVVRDIDAHAWVEAWFPHYGWVRFDPTPAAAPARAGGSLLSPLSTNTQPQGQALAKRRDLSTVAATPRALKSHGGTPVMLLVVVGAALLALLALAARMLTVRSPRTGEQLLAELERALVRSGRPLADGVTLATLERRFRSAPDAAAYIRALRMIRFAGGGELPSRGQRRALRAELGAGLGTGGRLRALWALPPRR